MKALAAFFLCLALFYGFCLPQFIQGGDTAELVAAAHLKLVAHPPGYPIWIWLQHFWLKLPLGTLFWRASLLSLLFGLSSLALLVYFLRKERTLLWLCLPLLALSTGFREAALLPDVFSLHGLLVTAVGGTFFFAESRLRTMVVPFLLTLGLAHQLTIVLLYPLLVALIWEEKSAKGRILFSALAGVTLAGAGYASLFSLDSNSPFSWGELKNFSDLWHHFARTDYGSFRLNAEGSGLGWAPLLHLSLSLLEILPLLALAALTAWQNPRMRKDGRFRAGVSATCLTLLFFLVVNVSPTGMGGEILLRFHLMPLVFFSLLSAYVLKNSMPTAKTYRLGYLLALPALTLVLLRAGNLTALRNDSVIEDYARNALTESSHFSPALMLIENDHAYFALQYMKSIFHLAPNVAVASPRLFFHPWYLNKIRATLPNFDLADHHRAWEKRELELERDLISPNISKTNFFFTRSFRGREKYRVTYLGLGRVLSQGDGQQFSNADGLIIRSLPSAHGPQAYGKKILFAQYADYFLAKGLTEFSAGRQESALLAWHQALTRVPYAWPALENICRLTRGEDPLCEEGAVNKVREAARGIYWMQ